MSTQQDNPFDVMAEAIYGADLAIQVWCEDCDHAIRHFDGAKSEMPAYRWLCIKAPRKPVANFVSRTLAIEEPYYRCSVVNARGDCRWFEPKREAGNV